MQAPALIILTTADPAPGVMRHFAESLAQLSGSSVGPVAWMVVDGLHTCTTPPLFPELPDNIQLEWLRPPTPLSQLAATLYGLARIDGPVIVMDPDMPDNVADIARFQAAHLAGAEIVFGRRTGRPGTGLVRKMFTSLYNRWVRAFLGLPLHDFNSPMISFSHSGLIRLLQSPADCPSPRLHACFNSRLGEVPIHVREQSGKPSTYTLKTRMAVGVMRLREVLAYKHYRRRARITAKG